MLLAFRVSRSGETRNLDGGVVLIGLSLAHSGASEKTPPSEPKTYSRKLPLPWGAVGNVLIGERAARAVP